MTKFWKDLHQAICSTLKEEIPAIQTCEIYPAIRKELLAPAVFVELIPSPVSNETNEKELFLPIIGELSKFITRPICFPNNEYWY